MLYATWDVVFFSVMLANCDSNTNWLMQLYMDTPIIIINITIKIFCKASSLPTFNCMQQIDNYFC